MKRVTIYTDGGCKPNPGPGGWGAVVLAEGGAAGPPDELSGRAEKTTNNRMELTAAVEALRALSERHAVTLVTDSTYVKNGITRWLPGWRAKGWKTSTGGAVRNQDLWEALDLEIGRHHVTWTWVKGHSGDRWNEFVDALATKARERGQRSEPAATVAAAAGRLVVVLGIAWSGRGRRGAWSALVGGEGEERMLGARCDGETANRLHLMAALGALAELPEDAAITLLTPSSYLRDGIGWISGWRRRGWRTRDGGEVSNRDLWEALAGAMTDRDAVIALQTKREATAEAERVKRHAHERLAPGAG